VIQLSAEDVLTFHEGSYTGGPYSAKVVGVTPFGERVEKTITIVETYCASQTLVLKPSYTKTNGWCRRADGSHALEE
jgi:hypothetical protein